MTSMNERDHTAEEAAGDSEGVTALQLSAPARIYLDIGEPLDIVHPPRFDLLEGVTWSEDNATSHGVPYVRADLPADYHAALQRVGTALGLAPGSDTTTACVPAIAAPRATQPAPTAPNRITLDFKQAAELLDMFGGEPAEITLMNGRGHSGDGLYAVYTADQDGSIYLGQTDDEATPMPVAARPEPFAEVFAELARATTKFPTWPTDPLHALAVLGEEFGELTKDMLQMVYEPHKTSRENVRTEALQTAAMALRLFASLEAYEYRPGTQHSQSTAVGATPSAAEVAP